MRPSWLRETLLLARALLCVPTPLQPQYGLSPDMQRVVYIIGGQSQASGKGLTSELTYEERARAAALGRRVQVEYPKVDLSSQELDELKDALRVADTWRPALPDSPSFERPTLRRKSGHRKADDARIRPGSSTLGEVVNGSKGCTFGPEVGFGLRMAEAMPNSMITLLKVTWPGVNITRYRNALYPTILSSLRRFKENHGEFVLGGMIWLLGEMDAGFNQPDFLGANETYPSAASYGAELHALVRALRNATGVQVPFATVTLRIFHATADPHKQPHNVQMVNLGMHDAAAALPLMFVVDGSSREFTRYFDDTQHCVPSDVQTCLGWLWSAFGTPCTRLDDSGGLAGSCSSDEAQQRISQTGHPGCMPQHDLHFTANGQKRVGEAFAEKFLNNCPVPQL